MHLLVPHLATDIEAERRRSVRPAIPATADGHRCGPRRAAAVLLARISLTSAAAVRRLDACIAEDLVGPRVAVDGV